MLYAVAYAALTIWFVTDFDRAADVYGGISFAATISLSGVAAVWVAWGMPAWWLRLASGTVVVAFASVLIFLLLQETGNSPETYPYYAMPAFVFVVCVVPLVFGRLLWGFRIAPNQLIDSTHVAPYQFGIRQLLIATTIVAAMLAIGRATLANAQIDEERAFDSTILLTFSLILSGCSIVAAWLEILVGLAIMRWIWILPIAAVVGGVGVAEYHLIAWCFGSWSPNPDEFIWILVQWHVAQWFAIVWPLLAFRALGFSLTRKG